MPQQQEKEAVALVLEMILDGELDGNERRIMDAYKTRNRVLNQKKAADFKKGDRIVFNDKAKPHYLRGQRGTIVDFTPTRVVVDVDADPENAGFLFDGAKGISCPFSIVDKDE